MVRTRQQQWAHASYLRHRAKVLEKTRQRRLADPQKHNAYQRDYTRTAKGRAVRIAVQAKRVAKSHGVLVNDLTSLEVLALLIKYRYRCIYCGCKPRVLSIDHVTPMSQGGPNTLHNVVPSCLLCNQKKSNGAPKNPVQLVLLVGDVKA